MDTKYQALNDALTEFVNRPASQSRRKLSAEFGDNFTQPFW
jgi:hypothetical protein